MPYPKAKIYKQGGHFIAIPHTEQPHKERRKAVETEIFVEDSPDETQKTTVEIAPLSAEESKASEAGTNPQIELFETKPQDEMPKPKRGRITTKRKFFDELYKTYYSEKKRTRRKLILQAMLPYFKTADDAAIFVDKRLRQKQENFIARWIRMTRKASLTNFNYFVTFTYDSALHTEESFKKKLKKTLSNFAVRKVGGISACGKDLPKRNGCIFTECCTCRKIRCQADLKYRIVTVFQTSGGRKQKKVHISAKDSVETISKI